MSITVSVCNPTLKAGGLQKYVMYDVVSRTTMSHFHAKEARVKRRFRDFEWLHDSLSQDVRSEGVFLPDLPDKHVFGNMDSDYTDGEFIEIRRHQLEDYISSIILQEAFLYATGLNDFLFSGEGQFATAKIDTQSITRYLNSPVRFQLESEIEKATYTLLNFAEGGGLDGEEAVPIELLCNCAGLAFITMIKGGFFFSGRVGTGLVMARLPDGRWSAPSAIGAGGAGWGFQIGGEVTDTMIILKDQDALNAFCSDTQITMGTELSLSFGPLGRSAETDLHAGDGGIATVISYAHSKGLFVGISLQAALVFSRNDVNKAFYGKEVTPRQLLVGNLSAPVDRAEPLYRVLRQIESSVYNLPPERNWQQGQGNWQQEQSDDYLLAKALQDQEIKQASNRDPDIDYRMEGTKNFATPVTEREGRNPVILEDNWRIGQPRGSSWTTGADDWMSGEQGNMDEWSRERLSRISANEEGARGGELREMGVIESKPRTQSIDLYDGANSDEENRVLAV